jgi:hypothetical protein
VAGALGGGAAGKMANPEAVGDADDAPNDAANSKNPIPPR